MVGVNPDHVCWVGYSLNKQKSGYKRTIGWNFKFLKCPQDEGILDCFSGDDEHGLVEHSHFAKQAYIPIEKTIRKQLEHLSNQPRHPDNVTHQGIAISQSHMGTCGTMGTIGNYVGTHEF